MRYIKDRYWYAWLVWKLGALAAFIILDGNVVGIWILGVSLISSIPFYLYLFKMWPFEERNEQVQ